ncbi:MAG TPA: hypothetical protein VFE01_00330, partial [Terracidiphilus sp.]|nr:hypothetical protein [Terracidiphilus sp.]
MNRRAFLEWTACAMTSACVEGMQAQRAPLSIRLQSHQRGRRVPQSFIGLSYEMAQLSEPTFFSAQHKDLVALFRRLSPSGVLRIGGNTSEFCWFQATPETP